jgi:glycosyltransferase involved in cell wall biosynthesis
VVDGYTGFLVDTPNDMALKMQILSRNLNLVKNMGGRGKKIVEEKYSDEIFKKHLIDIMGSKEIRTKDRYSTED